MTTEIILKNGAPIRLNGELIKPQIMDIGDLRFEDYGCYARLITILGPLMHDAILNGVDKDLSKDWKRLLIENSIKKVTFSESLSDVIPWR